MEIERLPHTHRSNFGSILKLVLALPRFHSRCHGLLSSLVRACGHEGFDGLQEGSQSRLVLRQEHDGGEVRATGMCGTPRVFEGDPGNQSRATQGRAPAGLRSPQCAARQPSLRWRRELRLQQQNSVVWSSFDDIVHREEIQEHEER